MPPGKFNLCVPVVYISAGTLVELFASKAVLLGARLWFVDTLVHILKLLTSSDCFLVGHFLVKEKVRISLKATVRRIPKMRKVCERTDCLYHAQLT
ncbi:hypothetical protein AV530_011996 [Patagioenas fasciata monilis]|uniref:Uncharacterized protein n=1 Tax=Patagioenas fasciata monilis TaxID=372326 RepID=A0A1V4JUG6_PATFA|nr:hypothetical protein AV530_011996 [Patagioenas fasciata monilis]